jgi:hypothetical protein
MLKLFQIIDSIDFNIAVSEALGREYLCMSQNDWNWDGLYVFEDIGHRMTIVESCLLDDIENAVPAYLALKILNMRGKLSTNNVIIRT